MNEADPRNSDLPAAIAESLRIQNVHVDVTRTPQEFKNSSNESVFYMVNQSDDVGGVP